MVLFGNGEQRISQTYEYEQPCFACLISKVSFQAQDKCVDKAKTNKILNLYIAT